ncbi:MAG: oxygen-dependent coproporphyrinogen oxidase [Candidatus Zeuxoniibacter abyssi]|nr:MAG: oxygen-dependent coproporphyrinogen oxidase [Candidatus Persebacteraceae bacterium AB1(2)]
MSKSNINAVRRYLRDLHKRLVGKLQKADGDAFHLREWRGNLGRGHTATLDNGALFERAGVNYSAVSANKLPPAARKRRITTDGGYQAAGVSVVAHPQNPYCPTAHMNVRAFVTKNDWWFGGGMDLTPYYGFDEDCRHFHNTCKTALNALNETLYPAFKKACDEYFFIPHRNEARGIGGVFFDDYNKHSFAHSFALMRALGDVFLSAYLPILEQRRHTPFGKQQREWQQHRRGRYVEFNLLYDRGTLFGLQSGGRADMIFMSLPPSVKWGNMTPSPNSEEARLLKEYLPAKNWV